MTKLPRMALIPGGSFMMGSSKNEGDPNSTECPQREVTVPQFWMGKYPVTQAQYEAVMGKNPSRFSKNGANRPVERVGWNNAMAFCQKLSQQTGQKYRLPSEAEWEYACRAGTETPFHFGETITTDLANYCGLSEYNGGPTGKFSKATTEVGSFPANAFGLYDMHGNVWEWCLDRWHESYYGAPTDGSAWTTGGDRSRRILRGGSWYEYPKHCRSASRGSTLEDTALNSVGFRVVCHYTPPFSSFGF
jgi:formylglycine-generating enzyme required for sulfatase activity